MSSTKVFAQADEEAARFQLWVFDRQLIKERGRALAGVEKGITWLVKDWVLLYPGEKS